MIKSHRIAAGLFSRMTPAERTRVRRHGAEEWRAALRVALGLKGRGVDAVVRRLEWLAAGEPAEARGRSPLKPFEPCHWPAPDGVTRCTLRVDDPHKAGVHRCGALRWKAESPTDFCAERASRRGY